jgi:hypothetical protein
MASYPYKFSNLSDCVIVNETFYILSEGNLSSLAMVVDWKAETSNILSVDRIFYCDY